MPIRVVAILPKRKISPQASERAFRKYLRDFATGVQKEMREYPPRQPWKSRPPRTGPRAGGKRTGAYKAGWSVPPVYFPSSVTIINPVKYASAVGGSRRQVPGQARVLAARGWKSIQDVAPEVNRRVLPNPARSFYGST